MATRMQQRRGTAATWTSANPILGVGEIGYETDTNKFKIGDGSNRWVNLNYFVDANSILDGAPGMLNTLNELAEALGDDPAFFTTVATNLSNHEADGINVHGIADTSLLATKSYADQAEADAIATASADATTKANAAQAAAIAAAAADATTKANDARAAAELTASNALLSESASRSSEISNTVSAHSSATQNIHGIENTANLATKTYADNSSSSAVSTHNGVSTNVHGIADTANLVTLAGTKTLTNKTITSPLGLVKADVGLSNVDNTSDANKPVSTAAQTALDLKAPLASPIFTGTVTTPLSTAGYVKTNASGVLSSSAAVAQADVTGLTSDLALKAPLASPALTGTPTAPTATAGTNTTQIATTAFVTGAVADLIASAPGALNTLDELAAALGDDANFATTVTNSLAAKAPINSPTFTGTVTLPAAGIVFSDGTQSKAGVPSITTFATAISSSATLAAGEQDKFVPLTGAVTITLPATGYSTGQSIDFYQASGTGAQFASTNNVVGTPGLKFRTTNSVVTAMKTSSGWLVFGDLSA